MMDQNDSKHTLRHKFKHKTNFKTSKRFQTYKGTIDEQNYVLKLVQCKDETQLIFYKQILLQRIQLQRQLYSESMFASKIVEQTVVEIDPLTKKQQIFLYIFHPFFFNSNLCQYTTISALSTLQPLSFQQRCSRIENIMSQACMLLMRNTNQQLYSLETLLFDKQQQRLHLNPISFVGLQMLMYDESIPKQDFLQIVQLLGSFTFKQKPKQRFTIQLKFRAIGVLLLSMIFQKMSKIMIDKKEMQIKGSQTQLQKYIQVTNSLPKKFKFLLQNKMFKQKIKQIESNNNVRYYEFLTKIFVEEKKLTWTEVLNHIIPKKYSQEIRTQITITSAAIAQSIYNLSLERQSNRDILELLGLKQKNEMDLYFITLLADEKTRVEQLFKYKNIDQFIYNPQSFQYQNMVIYKKILKLVSKIFQKQKFHECEIYTQQFLGVNKKKIQQKQKYAVLPELQPKLQNFEQFLHLISRNFETYETKCRNKKRQNRKEDSKALQMYFNLFM